MATSPEDIQHKNAISLDGCDVQRLVEISEQFNELELDFTHYEKITAARIANDKADWTSLGRSLSEAYQALEDQDAQTIYQVLKTMEHLLARHGVLVAQPQSRTTPTTTEVLPEETEFTYGD